MTITERAKQKIQRGVDPLAVHEWMMRQGSSIADADKLTQCTTVCVADLIEQHSYEGIRDQDGCETLELTVRARHSKTIADMILAELLKKR